MRSMFLSLLFVLPSPAIAQIGLSFSPHVPQTIVIGDTVSVVVVAQSYGANVQQIIAPFEFDDSVLQFLDATVGSSVSDPSEWTVALQRLNSPGLALVFDWYTDPETTWPTDPDMILATFRFIGISKGISPLTFSFQPTLSVFMQVGLDTVPPFEPTPFVTCFDPSCMTIVDSSVTVDQGPSFKPSSSWGLVKQLYKVAP